MDEHRPTDPVSYEQFVAGRYGHLVRFGALLTGDRLLGEDLAQEGLIAVYRAWRRVSGPEGRPEAYVRRVMVRSAARTRRRRRIAEVPASTEFVDVAHAGFAEQSDLSAHVFAALRALPTDQRMVLVLRFWADASEAETAHLLDVPIGTVKSRTSRALASLRASGLLIETHEGTP